MIDKVQPTRPKRVKRKSPPVPQPLSKEDKEVFDETKAKPTSYAPQMKVGKPTISIPGEKITTVGLGNLKVITQNGNPNV